METNSVAGDAQGGVHSPFEPELFEVTFYDHDNRVTETRAFSLDVISYDNLTTALGFSLARGVAVLQYDDAEGDSVAVRNDLDLSEVFSRRGVMSRYV